MEYPQRISGLRLKEVLPEFTFPNTYSSTITVVHYRYSRTKDEPYKKLSLRSPRK